MTLEEMFARMRAAEVKRDPFVLVFRRKDAVDGFPPKEGETAKLPHDGDLGRGPLSLALTITWPDDAHLVQYDFEPTTKGPLSIRRRLNVDLFRKVSNWADVPKSGIVLSCVLFDVDGPDHKWTPEWWATELPKIEALRAAHPAVLVYVTAGGYRIVGLLEQPFVLRRGQGCLEDEAAWKGLYRSWLRYLRRFGISADCSCDQWNRLFRVPRATRDGVVQDRETIGNPGGVGVWAPALRPEEIVTVEHVPATACSCSAFEPMPLTYQMDEGYRRYRIDPADRYLANTARVVCFATSGQEPKRRDVMLGICGVLLWKFRLPIAIAGDRIEHVYNARVIAAGKVPWNRSESGDYGMSIDERLAAASIPSAVMAPATDIESETSWRIWRDLLAELSSAPVEPITNHELESLRTYVNSVPPDAARTELGNVLAALGRLGDRNDNGSRKVKCPCGHDATISAKGRFKCSDKACVLRTKDGVLRALLEMSNV